MPKVTIEVSRLEEAEMHELKSIEERAFPGRRVIRYYHGAVAKIEVEGSDARDLIDALDLGLDDPAFEASTALAAASAKQSELPLENAIKCARATC